MFAKCSASSKAHEVAPETLVKYHTERANLERKKKQWGLNHHVQNIFRSPKTKPEVSNCFQRCFSAQRYHNTATALERHTHALTDRWKAGSSPLTHMLTAPKASATTPATHTRSRIWLQSLLERNAEHETERDFFIKKEKQPKQKKNQPTKQKQSSK